MVERSPTFPTFVLPFKRFATDVLIEMAERYLRDPKCSYRKAVLHQRCQIGYPPTRRKTPDIRQESSVDPAESIASAPTASSPTQELQPDVSQATGDLGALETPSVPDDNDSESQAVVAPNLTWRFIFWLGRLWALDRAREMILKLNPNSLCHRITGAVDPQKHRSDQRRQTLEMAWQLLQIIPEWEALHGTSAFPRFATKPPFD